MLEIGQFDKAMAFAPAVSLKYWRDIALRIAKVKGTAQMEDPAQYFQIAHDIDSAVHSLQNSHKFQNAKLIKTLDSNNLLKNAAIQFIKENQQEEKERSLPNLNQIDFQSEKGLKQLVNTQAAALFNKGKQILAASAHLSINDTSGCLQKLVRANELYLALVIANLMNHPTKREIVMRLAQRAERLKMNKFAAQLYRQQKQLKKIAFLVKRLRDAHDPSAKTLSAEYKIQSPQHFKKRAEHEDPHLKTHIFNLIMGGDIDTAARKIITFTKQILHSADAKHIDSVLEAFETIQEVRITGISEKNLKAEILLYSAAIGAIKALYLGFYRIIPALIGAIFSIIDHQHLKPAFDLQMFQIIEETITEIPKSQATVKISPQFQTQIQKKQYQSLYKSVEKYYTKKSGL